MFRNPKVPENALFPGPGPGAGLYGKGFLLFFYVAPIFPEKTIYLFAFSNVLFSSDNNSETGFGQISKFPRGTFFSDFGLVKD